MKNGRFTAQEREYLLCLDAVEDVRATCIMYSASFKHECLRRYNAGESPSRIFASAGLPASLIGYKRIERAIYHWKEADKKDALGLTDPPTIKRRKHADRLLSEKKAAVERQRNMRKRDRQAYEARIRELEAQVELLKAEGALAKKCGRADRTLTKSEKFALIEQILAKNPQARLTTLCKAINVSRSGYYKWKASAAKRSEREHDDQEAKALIQAAFTSHGFKKGSRQVKDSLARDYGIVMNRKKIQRIMRKYGIIYKPKRKNPYHPIGADGAPKTAPNLLNRHFHQGQLRKVLTTDITYIPYQDGFCYLSAILDTESGELLAHVTSRSLALDFVLETFDQIKHEPLAPGALIHSDQGIHYTARAYRAKISELQLTQSMSRKACCWDNACIESWFGRMKEQIGPTKHMTFTQINETINTYINYYNHHRGQARLNWMTPKEYAATLTT